MSIQLGKVGVELSEAYGHRDALHVSYVLVWCAEPVIPGDQMMFLSETQVGKCSVGDEFHGVVDPFVLKTIPPRTAFILIVRPCYVANVTHTFKLRIPGMITFEDSDDQFDECRNCN